jgi:hypothetical protein
MECSDDANGDQQNGEQHGGSTVAVKFPNRTTTTLSASEMLLNDRFIYRKASNEDN